MEVERLCELVYDRVKSSLYRLLIKMMLEQQWPNLRKEGLNSQLEQLIRFSWEHRKDKDAGFFQSLFHTKASCIAIGAPTHLFLPEVAEALGTKCILPRYAEVANAVGAIVGNVAVTHTVEIKPIYTAGGTSGYTVLGQETRSFEDQQEAIEYAQHLAVAAPKKRLCAEASRERFRWNATFLNEKPS